MKEGEGREASKAPLSKITEKEKQGRLEVVMWLLSHLKFIDFKLMTTICARN